MNEQLAHLDELFTLSQNFREPVGILVNDRTVTAIVEEQDDKRVKLSGEWYRLQDIEGIVS